MHDLEFRKYDGYSSEDDAPNHPDYDPCNKDEPDHDSTVWPILATTTADVRSKVTMKAKLRIIEKGRQYALKFGDAHVAAQFISFYNEVCLVFQRQLSMCCDCCGQIENTLRKSQIQIASLRDEKKKAINDFLNGSSVGINIPDFILELIWVLIFGP